jgi:PAS domain S-box-containing protein
VSEPIDILVVDDHPENRTAVRAILGERDYHVVEAGSGVEALRRLLEGDYAMLLLDVVMPDMNGFELAATIRQRARSANIPILFLTAEATDSEEVYRGYRSGAVDYLVKPIQPAMLRAKVEVFAQLHRQHRQLERQGARLVAAERREQELRVVDLRLAAERHYRALADAMPHVVWSAGPDQRVDYVNRRWFELANVSGTSWDVAIAPQDLSRWYAWLEGTRQRGEGGQLEVRLRTGASSYRWQLARVVPERGQTGEVVSWLGTFTDIEDQKRTETVLREFKGTLDVVLDAVMMFSYDGWRVVYANEGARVLLGRSHDELHASRPVDFLADYDDARFAELLGPLRASGRLIIDAEMCRRDGRKIPVELSLQQIDETSIVAIARDITDRKHAELEREALYRQAVEAVHARDDFLSVASHELKTPLSSLQLLVGTLLRHVGVDGEAGEPAKAKLEIAARQIDRLTRLIGELMDLSQIRAGKLRLALEDLDLAALVRDVVARFAEDLRRAGCVITLDADAPVTGRWDRLRVEQIVTNLLSNAMKFGGGKPIEIRIAGDDGRARLVVRDHGPGIAPEDRERIFERYERATEAQAVSGLGLGLYIVRQIVLAHGGTIDVASRPGEGATFTVELPREAIATTAPSHIGS